MTFVLCFRQSSYVHIYFATKICAVGDGEPRGTYVAGELCSCHQIDAILGLDVACDASSQHDALPLYV